MAVVVEEEEAEEDEKAEEEAEVEISRSRFARLKRWTNPWARMVWPPLLGWMRSSASLGKGGQVGDVWHEGEICEGQPRRRRGASCS